MNIVKLVSEQPLCSSFDRTHWEIFTPSMDGLLPLGKNIPSAGVITASWQSVAKQADAPVRR